MKKRVYVCTTHSDVHAFFISNTFISNARRKLVKNQAKPKQHAEAELVFENCFPYPRYHTKIIGEPVRLFKRGYMINDNENEAENEN